MKTSICVLTHNNWELFTEWLAYYGLFNDDADDLAVILDGGCEKTRSIALTLGCPTIIQPGSNAMKRDAAFLHAKNEGSDNLILLEDDAFVCMGDWKEKWIASLEEYELIALPSNPKLAKEFRDKDLFVNDAVCGSVIGMKLSVLDQIGYHHPSFHVKDPSEGWGYCDSEWYQRYGRMTMRHPVGYAYGIKHAESVYKKFYSNVNGIAINKNRYDQITSEPAKKIECNLPPLEYL